MIGVGNAEGRFEYIHIPTMKRMFSVEEKDNCILCCDFSKTGEHFATAGKDSNIRVYDESTLNLQRRHEVHFDAAGKRPMEPFRPLQPDFQPQVHRREHRDFGGMGLRGAHLGSPTGQERPVLLRASHRRRLHRCERQHHPDGLLRHQIAAAAVGHPEPAAIVGDNLALHLEPSGIRLLRLLQSHRSAVDRGGSMWSELGAGVQRGEQALDFSAGVRPEAWLLFSGWVAPVQRVLFFDC